MTPLSRRTFLRTTALGAAALALPPEFWRQALAAPATPGPGPYGPPGAPDPVTGIAVPSGFKVREVARGGQVVPGTTYQWHLFSDGSGCFAQPDGGWVLASNSEVPGLPAQGGASSITFDKEGNIVGARRILSGTTMNCAGGITPWGTWLSGEEAAGGLVWECDPLGVKPAISHPAMGTFSHEAISTDPVGKAHYLTEDTADGCFYRFTPKVFGDLTKGGKLEAMIVAPDGKVTWGEVRDPSGDTRNQVAGAARFARGEGTWYDDDVIYFVTTTQARLYALHLSEQVLELVYDGSALGLQAELTGIDNVTVHRQSGDVFVAEDANTDATLDVGIITPERVFARFLTASGPQHEASELTGPSFDPSGTRLYIASQRAQQLGAVYEITGPFRLTRPALTLTSEAPDRRRPRVRVRVLGTATVTRMRRNGLPVEVRSDEAATVAVVVRDARRGRNATLARATGKVVANRATTIAVRPGKAVSERLRGRRSVPVIADVRVTDAAGNTTTVTRRLRLR